MGCHEAHPRTTPEKLRQYHVRPTKSITNFKKEETVMTTKEHPFTIRLKQTARNFKLVKGIKFPDVKFDMSISFDLQGKHGIHEPEAWFLKNAKGFKSVKRPRSLFTGTGFSFNSRKASVDGLRDLSFVGSREQMEETANLLAKSPFRIAKISVSVRDDDYENTDD